MNKKNEQKIAAGYIRVSTPGQVNEGYSLELQQEAIKKYCTEKGFKLYKIYEDKGLSGGNFNRPGFQEMLQDAKSHKFDVLVVYKVDRLSRSILDFHQTMKILSENGIDFVSITQQFDTSTSMGRLTLGILADFANFEREINVERAKESYIERLRKGKHSGRTPFGYKRVEGKLVVSEPEAFAVREAFDLALKGYSTYKIAQELKFPPEHIKSILSNPFYTGYVCPRKDKHGHRLQDPSLWYKGEHEGIISLDTYLQVQENKKRQTSSKRIALFNRMIYCPYCNHNLTVRHRKYTKKEETYYSCLPIKYQGEACYRSIKQDEVETMLLNYINKVFSLKIPKQKTKKNIQVQLQKIEERIQKVADLLDKDYVSVDFIKNKIENLKRQKEQILSQQPTIDYKLVTEKFKEIKDVYEYATMEEKKELWSMIIEKIILYDDKIEVHLKDGTKAVINREKIEKTKNDVSRSSMHKRGGDEGI